MKTILIILGLLFVTPGLAAEKKERSKFLKFDGEVLEGMDKAPVDAMEDIAHNDKAKKAHLYRKRAEYREEMKQLSTDLGYQP
jgi:hypothetical protein